ncbi:MAG TPA: hypothetical protein VN457_01780, partial [Chlamydiales bacterium]|nr:hypothetical protein [Chlamydiales bacterium]
MATSCTSIRPADDRAVSSLVNDRIGTPVCWNQEKKNEQVKKAVDYLRSRNLSVDAAVEIALLNNPTIQAQFEELGIAEADLIEAGLLQNPLFEGFIRFPNRSTLHTNCEFSVTQNFLDIFLIPLRKKVA